jgi:hypothetical protein
MLITTFESICLFSYLTFHICCDVYIYISLQSSMHVFYHVLMYKDEPYKQLIGIGSHMGREYILKYQGLIEQFVNSCVALLPLFYNYWNTSKPLFISMLCHGAWNSHKLQYGVGPIKDMSRDNMWNGFEIICIVYELLVVMVCFLIYKTCILQSKCRYTCHNLFLCL